MEPLISVIIPVYNVEKYLDRCLESVTGQSYYNLEMILIDDGSTDSSPLLCNAWGAKDRRIRVIHQENGGMSAARNTGLQIAHGEYIAFVDSDDRIMPDLFEKLLSEILTQQVDIACCNVYKVWENSHEKKKFVQNENCILDTSQAMRELLLERKLKNIIWNKLYKADTIQTLFFPVGKYHEDAFWSFRAIANAKRICCIDYFGYEYYQRPDSIMGVKYSEKRLDGLEAQLDFTDFLCMHFPSLASLAHVRLFETCLYHGQMTVMYLSDEKKDISLNKITKMMRDGKIHFADFIREKPEYGLWFSASKINFSFVCGVRNRLGIGL